MKKTIFVFLSLAIIMFVNIGASRHPITLSIIKSSTSWRSMFYVLDEFAVANNTTTAKYKVYVSTNSNFFKLAMPFYVGGTTQTYRAYIDTAGYIYSLSSGNIAGSMTANSFIGNGASLTGVLCSSVAVNAVTNNTILNGTINPATKIASGILPVTIVASSVAVNAVTTNTILNDAVNPVTKIGAGLMASDVIVSSVAKGAITDNVLPDKFTATSATITAISCTNIWGDGSHLTGVIASGSNDATARLVAIPLAHNGYAFATNQIYSCFSPNYAIHIGTWSVAVDSCPTTTALVYRVRVSTKSATNDNFYATNYTVCYSTVAVGKRLAIGTKMSTDFATLNYIIPADARIFLDVIQVDGTYPGGNNAYLNLKGSKQ